MPDLKVERGGKITILSFTRSPILYDVLAENGFVLPRICGGKGTCGKCRVHAKGSIYPVPRRETVLACQSRLTGDASVTLGGDNTIRNIAAAGELPSFDPEPMPGRIGLAIDIGTTTLSAQLTDLPGSVPLSAASSVNPQRIVAADVIGRIEDALAGGGPKLQKMIREALNSLAKEVCKKEGIDISMIDTAVITGNTTMLYLLTGRDTECLARAPFIADCLFGEWVCDNTVYFPACVSAFVGADITCAVLASEMYKKSETSLLIDIGTNGEIALQHKGKLSCCATAAGPAFEGGGISCGSGSVPGAIDTVSVVEGSLQYTTINEAPAVSICGSGLIDAAASLLNICIVDETGAMEEEEATIAPGVTLTRKDIRMIQLAKGAISAGIKTLCETAGVSSSDIQTLYIAGSFGSRLNLVSAARIGLIPRDLAGKARILGNAALSGALLMLMSKNLVQTAKDIASHALSVNLGCSTVFSDNFAECMMFPENQIIDKNEPE